MKFIIPILITCFILFGCEGQEGQQGPVGPQGQQGLPGQDGEDGQPGVNIIPITGIISNSNYFNHPDYGEIRDYRIDEGDVVQLYFSPDPNEYAWAFYWNYYVGLCWIRFTDSDQDALGWHYLILLIKG